MKDCKRRRPATTKRHVDDPAALTSIELSQTIQNLLADLPSVRLH
jgi:hypothetical protein